MSDRQEPGGEARPRPAYGEYATPEEQRAAIRQPDPLGEERAAQEARIPVGEYAPPPRQPAATEPDRLRGDRIATWVLLAVGAFSVLSLIPSLFRMPEVFDLAFAQNGMPGFTSDELANSVALVMGVEQIGLLALAAWLSIRSMRRGRVSWWIPLVIGVVANLIFIVLGAYVMLSDPAFSAYVNQMMEQSAG